MVTFTSIAGVPLRYDRLASAPYGSRGIPYDFKGQQSLVAALTKACDELWARLPQGKPDLLLSAGAYVDKAGQHAKGIAFDFDGFWHGDQVWVTTDYPQDRKFYCGVQACLMRQFGVVLNYHFNERHRDHFHIDLSEPLGWRAGGKSCVLCAQTILRDVWGTGVAIDGSYGAQSKAAFAAIGITDPTAQWGEFLTATIDRAFGALPVEVHPDEDTPSPWAAKARDWAMAEGLTMDGSRPRDPVTREELWLTLHRYDSKRPRP